MHQILKGVKINYLFLLEGFQYYPANILTSHMAGSGLQLRPFAPYHCYQVAGSSSVYSLCETTNISTSAFL